MHISFVVNESHKRAAFAWLFAAFALSVYASLVVSHTFVPGVADILLWLQHIDTRHIYVTALLAASVEGLYVVGAFFPGTSLIFLSALTAGLGGVHTLVVTSVAMYIGWLCAGVVNVAFAKRFVKNGATPSVLKISKRLMLVTWYPAFRAAQEVAEVLDGTSPLSVFISSAYIKFLAVTCFFFGALLIPHVISVGEISNGDGVVTVFALAFCSFIVGMYYLFTISENVKESKREDVSKGGEEKTE